MAITTAPDNAKLKPWLVKKLSKISEADSDILSDYVIALMQGGNSESVLRSELVENLADFLGKNSSRFVEEVFEAIKTRSYDPDAVNSGRSPLNERLNQTRDGTSNSDNAENKTGTKRERVGSNVSSKHTESQRKAEDHDAKRTKISPPKGSKNARRSDSPRRGSRNHRRSRSPRRSDQYRPVYKSRGRHPDDLGGDYRWDLRRARERSRSPPRKYTSSAVPRESPISQPPMDQSQPPEQPIPSYIPPQQTEAALPLAFPMPMMGGQPFDPNVAFQALMTLSAMGVPLPLPLPDLMPTIGDQSAPKATPRPWIPSKKPCRHYESTGKCPKGVTCVYRHIDKPIKNQTDQQKLSTTGMERVYSNPRNVVKSDFSAPRGLGNTNGLTAIVVENIPDECSNHEKIQEFFSQFGTVKNIIMRGHSRLAIVDFADATSAEAAIGSSKVIFDNRFVKVFWYLAGRDDERTDGMLVPASTPLTTTPAEEVSAMDIPTMEVPTIDLAALHNNTKEAQKRHEERQALVAATELKRRELIAQQQVIEQKKGQEIQRLKALYAAKGKSIPSELEMVSRSDDTATSSAQLSAPEGYLGVLGIDPDPSSNTEMNHAASYGYGSRGISARSGRGGHYVGTTLANGNYNLDNRPKTVKIEGIVFDVAKIDNLKEYLMHFGDYLSVDSAVNSSAQMVTFKDRSTAEAFFHGSRDIPGVGIVTFSWVSKPLRPSSAIVMKSEDIEMGNADNHSQAGNTGHANNLVDLVDYSDLVQ